MLKPMQGNFAIKVYCPKIGAAHRRSRYEGQMSNLKAAIGLPILGNILLCGKIVCAIWRLYIGLGFLGGLLGLYRRVVCVR